MIVNPAPTRFAGFTPAYWPVGRESSTKHLQFAIILGYYVAFVIRNLSIPLSYSVNLDVIATEIRHFLCSSEKSLALS